MFENQKKRQNMEIKVFTQISIYLKDRSDTKFAVC